MDSKGFDGNRIFPPPWQCAVLEEGKKEIPLVQIGSIGLPIAVAGVLVVPYCRLGRNNIARRERGVNHHEPHGKSTSSKLFWIAEFYLLLQ